MADVIRVFLEDLPIRLAEIGDAVTHRNAGQSSRGGPFAQRGGKQSVAWRAV